MGELLDGLGNPEHTEVSGSGWTVAADTFRLRLIGLLLPFDQVVQALDVHALIVPGHHSPFRGAKAEHTPDSEQELTVGGTSGYVVVPEV